MITTRGVGRYALVIGVASLLLAGCTSSVVALSAVGVPSISLVAPLTTVACTSTGTCLTLGASGAASGPTTAAQIRNHKGVWSALRVPAALGASFDTASCATNVCLFAGAQSTGDLLWSINADDGATTTLSGPAGGLLIRNLSCPSDSGCVAIDQAAHGLTRWSSTTDAGTHWSAPRTLAWALDASTVLDCLSLAQCYLATTSRHHLVSLRETLDGGVTWTVITTPSTWTSLTSLDCHTTCTALVTQATGSSVATPSKTSWTQTDLGFSAAAMSCATPGSCLVVGHSPDQSADMTQWQSSGLRRVSLTYVPSPLTNVACRANVCVAVGVTTTVALRP